MTNNRSGGLQLGRSTRAAVDMSMSAVQHLLDNLTPEHVREFLNGSPDTRLPWLMNYTIREISDRYAQICSTTGARNLIDDLRTMSGHYEAAGHVVPAMSQRVTRGLAYAANSEMGDGMSVENINVLSDAVRARVAGNMTALEDQAIQKVLDEVRKQFETLKLMEQQLELAEKSAHAIGNSSYSMMAQRGIKVGSGISTGAVFLAARYIANEPSHPLVELACLALSAPTYFLVKKEAEHAPNSATIREGVNHAGMAALALSGSLAAQVFLRKAAASSTRFFLGKELSDPSLSVTAVVNTVNDGIRASLPNVR